MATKFYLHDAATPNTGTMPGSSDAIQLNGAAVATGDATGARTARDATSTIGVANPDTESQVTATANQNAQTWGHRRFVTRPLAATTIATATTNWDSNIAAYESNTNHTTSGLTITITGYPWRPGTGARIGTDFVSLAHAVGSVTTETCATRTTGGFNTDIVLLDGDILVFDVATSFTQTMSTAYTENFSYDGTVEGTNGSAATTNASFVNCDFTLSLFTGGTAASLLWNPRPAVRSL